MSRVTEADVEGELDQSLVQVVVKAYEEVSLVLPFVRLEGGTVELASADHPEAQLLDVRRGLGALGGIVFVGLIGIQADWDLKEDSLFNHVVQTTALSRFWTLKKKKKDFK